MRHSIRVRYSEIDGQRVVFNAHYLAYCDDAVDTWLRALDTDFERFGWDIMLKRAVIEWQGSAGIGDTIDIDLGVTRWGTTSLDVGFTGTVGERPVFTATITYVGVAYGTKTPTPPPDEVRTLLSA
jgi:YbgC/YbaW family acyl-CoA thioester hydrolase